MKISLSKPELNKKDISVILNALKSGWLTHGPENLKFENSFRKKIGTKYAISMNSCTSALECSLKVLERKGEVIIPSWTWVSTANAVLNSGNKPVFADVDLESRNITANEIKKKITKKTVAVIVVHYAGLMCDMGPIVKLLKKHKIDLVEDSAECLGATYKKQQAGSFGTGCFSFFPTKNITTTEGGMLTTNSKSKYEKIKKIIAHGINKGLKKKPWHRISDLPGHNFRLPNHLAALGSNQLKRLEKFNIKRRLIAKNYDKFFKNYLDMFKTQKINKDFTHSYQMYSIVVKERYRDDLVYYLKKNNIEASVHFDPPLHKQAYLKKYAIYLKNTEELSKTIVTLPIYPGLDHLKQKYMFGKINQWYRSKNL